MRRRIAAFRLEMRGVSAETPVMAMSSAFRGHSRDFRGNSSRNAGFDNVVANRDLTTHDVGVGRRRHC